MRTFAWTVVLAAMLIPAVAWAQQGPGPGKGPEGVPPGAGGADPAKVAADLQRQQMELEIEARKDDLQLQRERHKLEIEKQHAEIEMMRNRGDGRHHGPGPLCGLMALMFIGCLVSHILLTIWVCQDRRARVVGCGLWVPIILLTGVGGAIFYALVRLGDIRDPSAAPAGKGK